MDLGQAQRQLTSDLTPLYDSREAGLIADWVMEHLTGRSKMERLMRPAEVLADPLLRKYYIYRSELLAHRPVQYVLRESWFAGLRFYVDENVLIPRPETEELVEWACRTIPAVSSGPLLDVGTGSGCIAIALALKLPDLSIHACDISAGALHTAGRNAASLRADITFHHLDFLDRGTWPSLPAVRWIVSNPPYIPASERSLMAPHVAGAEPSAALFVPDSDPFVFYYAIGEFARQRLLPGGSVWVEIHENLAAGVVDLFRSAGAVEVETRKDLMGKDRMVKAGFI
ncbi:MAG TPA: peptide chain release factor N(5)-glutamine methyltransferase [Puia sp.]|nr:peptide chain release factor N(5)-glutamine methyltransferase [Puia sp.]